MPSERPTRDGDRPPAASDPIDRPDGGWSHAHHLDARHEPVTRGGSSFAYGPNGELAKKTDAVTFAETHSYDAHGNLRTVTCPAPLAVIDYVIDGQNRRIGKKIGGSLEQGSTKFCGATRPRTTNGEQRCRRTLAHVGGVVP
ncbi:MAG: hypothetical protein BGO98_15705 [Myxococcales bacterium 68-20]|nr:MAG: hypothetical protein BGO98_15705 [Myxococcales bacterium 68-20]